LGKRAMGISLLKYFAALDKYFGFSLIIAIHADVYSQMSYAFVRLGHFECGLGSVKVGEV